MRREIKQLINTRRAELAGVEKQVKDDLGWLLLSAFYEPVPHGKYAGELGIVALTKMYRDALFGITGLSKQQVDLVIKTVQRFGGSGEVAKEKIQEAKEGAARVVNISDMHVEGGQQPKVIDAKGKILTDGE